MLGWVSGDVSGVVSVENAGSESEIPRYHCCVNPKQRITPHTAVAHLSQVHVFHTSVYNSTYGTKGGGLTRKPSSNWQKSHADRQTGSSAREGGWPNVVIDPLQSVRSRLWRRCQQLGSQGTHNASLHLDARCHAASGGASASRCSCPLLR